MINNNAFRLNKRTGEPLKNVCYCRNPELIENYDRAMTDTTQTWDCHHRLESCFSSSFLKKMGLYYDQPPEAFIFLTHEEHTSIPHKGRVRTDKWVENLKKSTHKKLLMCVETKEVHFVNEWISLGYRHAYDVALGNRKHCKGLHFWKRGKINDKMPSMWKTT